MKVCQYCGTSARLDEQKFCAKCGRPFETNESEAPETPVRVRVPKQPQESKTEEKSENVPARRKVAEPKPEVPAEPAAAPARRKTVRPEPKKPAGIPPLEPIPVLPVQPETPASKSSQPENIPSLPAEEVQNAPAESFFQTRPEPEASSETLPDTPADLVDAVSEMPISQSKKGPPKVFLVLLVIIFAAALLGGFFLWKKIALSKNATVGGISYSIADTASLSVESPSDEDWNNLCRLSGLTSLTITGNIDLDARKLNELSTLQALTELSIDGAVFPDGLSSLASLSALESLSLTNCQLSSSQCDGGSWPVSLRKLDLSGNGLTDISFLRNCTYLEELFLDENKIIDYTPVAALTGLTTLGVDQCQVQAVNSLPVLKKLLVNGQEIEEPAAYLAELSSMTESYQNIISLFEAGDFDALTTVLQQLETAGSLDENVLTYANGWLMTNSSEWDIIRASLPSGSQMLVSDGNGLYYGQMNNGKRFGNGIQLFAVNHSIYSGSWNNDLPNGMGTYRKTIADGTVLEFAGNYTDGYENGTMTFTAASDSGTQSGSYTAVNGTRTTVEQISDNQVAFIRFDTIYWYDASPDGHGVAIASIPYQEEKVIQISPKAEPAPSNSKNGSGNKNSSGAESTPPSAPQPSAPTESSSASSSTADSSNPWNMTPEDALKKIQDGVQTASDIYHAAKEIYDMFN